MKIAERVLRIKPSPTLAAGAKAAAMRAQGIPVISFGQGEPDFDTPENIKQAAYKAIQEGVTQGGFGTVSSSIIALPGPETAIKKPVWRFAPGRPGEVPYEAVAL